MGKALSDFVIIKDIEYSTIEKFYMTSQKYDEIDLNEIVYILKKLNQTILFNNVYKFLNARYCASTKDQEWKHELYLNPSIEDDVLIDIFFTIKYLIATTLPYKTISYEQFIKNGLKSKDEIKDPFETFSRFKNSHDFILDIAYKLEKLVDNHKSRTVLNFCTEFQMVYFKLRARSPWILHRDNSSNSAYVYDYLDKLLLDNCPKEDYILFEKTLHFSKVKAVYRLLQCNYFDLPVPEKEEIELLTEILEYPNLYSCIQLLSNILALLKYNHDPKEHHFYFFLKALKDYQSIYIQYYPRLVNSVSYILLKYFSEQDKINEKVLSRILEVLDQSFETQRIGKKMIAIL